MSTTLKTAGCGSWRPVEYLKEYCDQVELDDQLAIRFQVEFLRRADRMFPRALEYGCGPTLMRAIAAAAYVKSLDMADHWIEICAMWNCGRPAIHSPMIGAGSLITFCAAKGSRPRAAKSRLAENNEPAARFRSFIWQTPEGRIRWGRIESQATTC